MTAHRPRLGLLRGAVLCGLWACQLVDPPSDLDRGGPATPPNDAGLDAPQPDLAVAEAAVDDDAGGGREAGAGDGGPAARARILCATGAAAYCPAGTPSCCYADPRGAGVCSTVDACTSSYLFQCSSFGGCGAGESCCGITAYLTLDGGSIVGIVGSRCSPGACSGPSPLVLCDFAETPDRCATGTTCQPWSSVSGNRWPSGYDACQ